MTGDAPVVHDLVAELDYPMFIATVAAGAERAGCLVGFTFRVARDAQAPSWRICSAAAAPRSWSAPATGAAVQLSPRAADRAGPRGVRSNSSAISS